MGKLDPKSFVFQGKGLAKSNQKPVSLEELAFLDTDADGFKLTLDKMKLCIKTIKSKANRFYKLNKIFESSTQVILDEMKTLAKRGRISNEERIKISKFVEKMKSLTEYCERAFSELQTALN